MSNALLNWHTMAGDPYGENASLDEIADNVGELLIQWGFGLAHEGCDIDVKKDNFIMEAKED